MFGRRRGPERGTIRGWLLVGLSGALLVAPTSSWWARPNDALRLAGPPHRATPARVGIDEAYRPFYVRARELDADFDAIKASGANWVSFDFDWSKVQAAGPNSFNWAPLDRVVHAANARGLKVLAIPDYTPGWARPARTDNKFPPSNARDFVTFVQAAVTRYAPLRVHTWAIWNEPNNPDFWKPKPDVAAYSTLLKATYPAIKALEPAATVITGGTAPAAGTLSPASWLAGLYSNGARNSFDAVGHHPYAALPFGPGAATRGNSFQQTLLLRNLMVRHGDSAKKIWGTEAGAYTGTARGAVANETQARFVTDYLRLWDRWSSFTGPLFLYELRDGGTNQANRDDNWGLLTSRGTPKPAWRAFTAALQGQSHTGPVRRAVRRGSPTIGP
jgi:polysaccharide biosynthesis protein PslG